MKFFGLRSLFQFMLYFTVHKRIIYIAYIAQRVYIPSSFLDYYYDYYKWESITWGNEYLGNVTPYYKS